MALISQNPATQIILGDFPETTPTEVQTRLSQSHLTFQTWKRTTLAHRQQLMHQLATVLRGKHNYWASLITQEMGCPISQTVTEIEKCAFTAEYYAEHSAKFLTSIPAPNVDAKQAYVAYEPLGPILHIAPWNYPFYLALRPTIPAIMAGNTVLLKHASNVPQCALALQAIFKEAGFPEGVFQSLLINSKAVAGIVADDRVAMVTLIGSEQAGMQVAQAAGQSIKKNLMELGGSDPFIVLADADIDRAVEAAVYSRLRNAGQSCNAAKRFIVMEEVVSEFTVKLKEAFEREVTGDPMDSPTTLGPLATAGQLEEIESQVRLSIELGAEVVLGAARAEIDLPGYFYQPTILAQVTKHMPVYSQEVFGPVAPIITVSSVEEAIHVANDNRLGLGASLWTTNSDLASELIPWIEAGNVYVNAVVRSNPKLPYGGIKKSGYGRELGEIGIKEFVNIKSVVIK